MPARQTYLIVETHSIAKALIDALGLVRSDELPKLRCYASDGVLLAESRARAVGGNAAVGTAVTASYLLGRLGHDAATRLFYVGSCEARPGAAEHLGRVVLANRVIDGLSGKAYYPDILLAHELTEAGIETLSRSEEWCDGGTGGAEPGGVQSANRAEPAAPGLRDAPGGGGRPEKGAGAGWRAHRGDSGALDERPQLVDRELAGFLAAALTFLAPHQVYCLAAVTGLHGASARETGVQGTPAGEGEPDNDESAAPVGASIGAITRLIEQAGQLLRPAGAPLSTAARQAIEGLMVEMRLTAAQSAQLRVLAEGAAARGLDVARIAASGRRAVTTKQERNRGFDELKRLFRQ